MLPRVRRFTTIATLATLISGLTGFVYWDEYRVWSWEMYTFENLEGPTSVTPVSAVRETSWTEYESGGASRLAILLTDPDSAWLGLARGLKSIGVPFIITDDYRRAVTHHVVLVYPQISGQVLSAEALTKLAEFARERGTLIGVNVLGGLNTLFGFEEIESYRRHEHITLISDHELVQPLNEIFQSEIRIARASNPDLRFGTHAYLKTRDPPLAVYDDGRAAITQRKFERGRAYAFGFDIGSLLQRSYGSRTEGIAVEYANHFEPSLDLLLGLLKRIYQEGEPNAVTLGTVPNARKLSLMLSHDIDYQQSMENAVAYAQHERGEGFAATHFLQTKYVRDWNDDIFFDDAHAIHVTSLQALGMELGSHSVSHSLLFAEFPLGDGKETYPHYQPFVKSAEKTYGGSILGELRVSKFLIESVASETQVSSFRPGHLRNPKTLPQSLATVGFRYSSSVTANVALTHLPFQLTHGRNGKMALDVFEFPITVEDELDAPMLNRLPEAIELANRIGRFGGIFVVLIHPDVLGQKLEFQKKLVAALKDSAWMGSIGEFGEWWAARDALEVDVINSGEQTVTVKLVSKTHITGLPVEVPNDWVPRFESKSPHQGSPLVVDIVKGQTEFVFDRHQ